MHRIYFISCVHSLSVRLNTFMRTSLNQDIFCCPKSILNRDVPQYYSNICTGGMEMQASMVQVLAK